MHLVPSYIILGACSSLYPILAGGLVILNPLRGLFLCHRRQNEYRVRSAEVTREGHVTHTNKKFEAVPPSFVMISFQLSVVCRRISTYNFCVSDLRYWQPEVRARFL